MESQPERDELGTKFLDALCGAPGRVFEAQKSEWLTRQQVPFNRNNRESRRLATGLDLRVGGVR